MRPIVAIVGRPNVGKSTLFNALSRKNRAIVHDLPGVTRDRNYLDVDVAGCGFTLVDTGGFDPTEGDDLTQLVKEQAQLAVDESDLVIFLMDGKEGLVFGDEEISRILQRSQKPVLYAVNKVEASKTEENVFDFYRLGIESIFSISAKHRLGLTELLEAVCRNIPESSQGPEPEDETVVSIIGRPNVGKSSLVNRILGQKRLLVSDVAGTTRDPVDTLIRFNHRTLRFIDTAGIRKKARIGYSLEKYCVLQALRSISRSSVCILMLDATQGVTTQDAKLADQVHERNRACIIVVNKWDLLEKDHKTHDRFLKQVRSDLAFIDYAPILTVSALTGIRVRNILNVIESVSRTYALRVATPELNEYMAAVYAKNPPPRGPKRPTKIYYAAQVTSSPPVFKIYTNNPKGFQPNYRRFLERAIRERFEFSGVPVCLQFVKRRDKKTALNKGV